MPIAAVPDYFKSIDYSELPPGHKYGMFFPVWDNNWKKLDGNKTDALKKVFSFEKCKRMSESLVARQKLQAESLNQAVFSLQAESLSPFMTGTGMEHPLENGFAFLAPYGLPYLAGSGVKGVLRRTAEYLRDLEFGEDNFGWNQAAIDLLFGPEPKNGDSETAHRGALVFWDVFIQPKDYKLGMDILTPHFGDYYKGESTPHESGQPNPVPFLVVPPEATFNFNIQCNAEFIVDKNILLQWRGMVEQLFIHCFDWLGFGAKTASGYGQLVSLTHLEQRKQEALQRQKEADAAAYQKSLADSGISQQNTVWLNAKVKELNAGSGVLMVENPSDPHQMAKGTMVKDLTDEQKNKWKKKKALSLNVEIEQLGNLIQIIKILE